MKKLSEHNAAAKKIKTNQKRPKYCSPAGVTCDYCGTELLFSGKLAALAYPAQKEVSCPECDWHGHYICLRTDWSR